MEKFHKSRHILKLVLLSLSAVILLFNFTFKVNTLAVDASESITKQNLFTLHNSQRETLGLNKLRYNLQLEQSATSKGEAMINSNCWSHYCPDGRSPWEFFSDSGYVFISAGENLAEGFYNVNTLMNAWMNSPTHRENIANSSYEEIGFGIINGGFQDNSNNIIVVAHFGKTNTTVSTTTPTINITSPVNGDIITTPNISVEGNATNLENVDIYLNNSLRGSGSILNGIYTVNLENITEGKNTLYAEATSPDLTSAKSNEVSFLVDFTPDENTQFVSGIQKTVGDSTAPSSTIPSIDSDTKNMLNLFFVILLCGIFFIDLLIVSKTKVLQKHKSLSHYHFIIFIIIGGIILIGGFSGEITNGIFINNTMKKYKLLIVGLKNPVQFYAPDFALNNRKTTLLIRLIVASINILYFLFLFILPLKFFIDFPANESSLFNFIIDFGIIILALYLALQILTKMKHIIDPSNFLSVLFFGLLVTLTAVFTANPSVENTFGTAEIKGLSGVAVMAMIILFYIVNFIVRDIKTLKKSIFILLSGSTLAVIYSMFTLNGKNLNLEYVIVHFLLITVLALSSLYFKSLRYIAIPVAVLGTLAILINPSKINSTGISTFVSIYLGIMFIVSVILTVFYVVRSSARVKEILSDAKLSFKKLLERKEDSKRYINFSNFLLLISPIILLLVTILAYIDYRFNLQLVSTQLSGIRIAINTVLSNNLSAFDINKILFGLGSTELSLNNSFIANVITTQGILGGMAYLFLLIFSVLYIFKTYRAIITERIYLKLFLILAVTSLFIAVSGLVIYPGLFLIILWWITFSLLSILPKLKDELYLLNNDEVQGFMPKKLPDAISLGIITLISIAVIAAGVYWAYALSL